MAPPLPGIPDVQVSPEEQRMNPAIEPMEGTMGGPMGGPMEPMDENSSVYDDKSYVMTWP